MPHDARDMDLINPAHYPTLSPHSHPMHRHALDVELGAQTDLPQGQHILSRIGVAVRADLAPKCGVPVLGGLRAYSCGGDTLIVIGAAPAAVAILAAVAAVEVERLVEAAAAAATREEGAAQPRQQRAEAWDDVAEDGHQGRQAGAHDTKVAFEVDPGAGGGGGP
jgi:hypothetical protein